MTTSFSTATRSLITSWIAFFSTSTAFSFSIDLSVVTRSRSIDSSSWSRFTRSTSTTSVRSLLRWATSTWRSLFWVATSISSSAAMRARSPFWRSSSRTFIVSASSRAFTLSTSRCCLATVSASWRSSSRIASRASTSCCLMTRSLSRWMLLESLAWVAVSSVIFLIPWASRMLSGSSDSMGVCSR